MVAAQSADVPQPSSTEATLWAHAAKGGAALWMSTWNEDPAGTDKVVQTQLEARFLTCFSFPMNPALYAPLTLNMNEDIQFNIPFATSAHAGNISTELWLGNTLVAAAREPGFMARDGSRILSLSAKPILEFLDPASGNLVWNLCFWGLGTISFQVGDGNRWCQLILPIVPNAATGEATTGNSTASGNETIAGNSTEDRPGQNETKLDAATPAKKTPVPGLLIAGPLLAAWAGRRMRNRLDR